MLIQGGGRWLKYNITQKDKDLLLQNSIDYQYRFYVIDKSKRILDEIDGIISIGTHSIESDSENRRTVSINIYLDNYKSIETKINSWIGYDFQFKIGIYDIRDNKYIWYDCGCYEITDANTLYDAINNSLSLSLSDWYTYINGLRNGQIGGAPIILLPNEDESGNIITIRDTVISLLKNETDIKEYIVDDIGQFYGMPQNNEDYLNYRKINPLWNQLPYDLEYNAGCSVGDIFSEIKNLYPNCQMYFDIYGIFCFDMIPSCENDSVIIDNDFLQQIIVDTNSENVTYSIGTIKNVTEVFGVDYEVDRFSTTSTFINNTYNISLENYEQYNSSDIIAFTAISSNASITNLQINSLSTIPLYKEYTNEYINTGSITSNNVYVIQIRKVNGNYVAYFLGQYQPHALCVLTSNECDTKYTKNYFAEKYNCNVNNIIFRVEPDSPFTIQKIGEVLDVKTGDEFDNILSDSVALENAIYFNKQSSTVNDTVTIITKMIPFLDVNIKVRYKKQQDDSEHEYIIKSISHNIEACTSQITMYRFYPLYYA